MASQNRFRAVFFDFGGVITTSPFDAFNRYEADAGLPGGLIRTINSTNPDANAWAKLERNEIDTVEFARAFEAEAVALGHEVDGLHVVSLLTGTIRPQMVTAVTSLKEAGYRVACLTNNFQQARSQAGEAEEQRARVLALFDYVIESSVVGVRKPEPEFYRIALETVEVEAQEVVFLDDLGINLKPARAMGMATIKVTDPDEALARLEDLLGYSLKMVKG